MPDFRFDKRTRTYTQGGDTVAPEHLRGWVSEILETSRGRMAKAADDYFSHRNRAQFTLDMRAEISRAHSAMAMLAQGGRKAMDEKAWGRAGQRVRSELEFLRGFERAIANGTVGSDEQIRARAQRYADALHATYEAAVIAREKGAGVKRVRRVLDTRAQHCEDCPGLAGEHDIDSCPVIGDSSCGGGCRCYIESLEEAA